MRSGIPFVSLVLGALLAFGPLFVSGFALATSVTFFTGPMLASFLIPVLVSASKGRPLYPYGATQNPTANNKPPFIPTNFIHDRQFGPKKGIVFQAGGEGEASEFTTQAQVGWAYNWAPNNNGLAGSVEFVPILWERYADEPQSVKDQWNIWTESNAAYTHVLGYNEPDQGSNIGGSSISASDTAAAWPGDMNYHGQYQSARAKFYLSSPAIAAGDYAWMDAFIADCNDCEFDFFAVHWYGSCDVDYLTSYLQEYHDRYLGAGQPMWVTEFGFEGCSSSSAEADAIVSAVNWLESTSWIERYAYWGELGTGNRGGLNNFLNSDNSWTCQGYAYINADNPC